MIPQISTLNETNTIPTVVPYPSFTFFVANDLIEGNVDGLAALRQAIQHILTTERYVYPIYNSNYGVELEQLKGKSMGYAKAKITNIIKDALLQDDRIIKVDIVNKISTGDILSVDVKVLSVLGEFIEELDFKIWQLLARWWIEYQTI